MTHQQQQILLDMAAYLATSIDANADFRHTVLQIGHDCYASLYPEHGHPLVTAGFARKVANI